MRQRQRNVLTLLSKTRFLIVKTKTNLFKVLYSYYVWSSPTLHVKGWVQKKLTNWNFVSAISQLIQHWNITILVPTFHNTLVIMWGRDKNFQVLVLYEQRNCENTFHLVRFFMISLYLVFRMKSFLARFAEVRCRSGSIFVFLSDPIRSIGRT